MPSEQVYFRAGGPLGSQLRARGAARGRIAKRDLQRYYSLLDDLLAELHFTEEEARALVESYRPQLTARPLAWSAIAARAPALVVRLHQLNPCQALAVVDAAERYWQLPESQRTTEGLRAVGLLT